MWPFKKSENDILQQDLKSKENNIKLQQNASFIGSSNDPFSTPTRDNYQTYPYDYYSSSDCKIFLGDIWCDDIVSIQYNCSQSKTPIYGYASQNFDAIAKGQILVQGTLAIAFKEVGYLNVIQATLEAQRRNSSEVISSKIKSYQTEAKDGTAKFIPRLNTIGEQSVDSQVSFQYSPNGSPQIIRQQQTIEQILTSKKGNIASSGVAKELGLGPSDNRDFEDFAEVLEDSIWGDSNGQAINLVDKLKRVDEFDYNSNGGITTAKGRQYSDVLNIMLTFGDINDYRAEHTMIVINDVHFTSSSLIVNTDGNPIFEEYTFIARDINDSITGKSINVSPIKLNVGIDNLKLSTLENVNEIEKFLNERDSNSQVTINFLSAYNGTWNVYNGQIIATFISNKTEPFTDQVCKFAENIVNEIYYPEIVNTSYSQYIIELDMTDNKLTMILEQVTANTRSYRVISPTRSGFAAVNIISRDDLFQGSSLPEPIQDRPISNTLTQKKQASINESTKVKEVQVTSSYDIERPFQEDRLNIINANLKETRFDSVAGSQVSDDIKARLGDQDARLRQQNKESDLEKQRRVSQEMQDERNLKLEIDHLEQKVNIQLPWYDVINPGIISERNKEKKELKEAKLKYYKDIGN
ncbi:MAG: hypothetical protein M0R17_05510 [Candidatus Omnitrophica bacterium]|jgi:hypothetical protein|nr:hypothetical protein [Candidatus Omnitrophota bacterium]